jgi:hypothetical protein
MKIFECGEGEAYWFVEEDEDGNLYQTTRRRISPARERTHFRNTAEDMNKRREILSGAGMPDHVIDRWLAAEFPVVLAAAGGDG